MQFRGFILFYRCIGGTKTVLALKATSITPVQTALSKMTRDTYALTPGSGSVDGLSPASVTDTTFLTLVQLASIQTSDFAPV